MKYFYCRFVAKWVIKHETKLNPVEVVKFFHPLPSGISWASYLGLSPNAQNIEVYTAFQHLQGCH